MGPGTQSDGIGFVCCAEKLTYEQVVCSTATINQHALSMRKDNMLCDMTHFFLSHKTFRFVKWSRIRAVTWDLFVASTDFTFGSMPQTYRLERCKGPTVYKIPPLNFYYRFQAAKGDHLWAHAFDCTFNLRANFEESQTFRLCYKLEHQSRTQKPVATARCQY